MIKFVLDNSPKFVYNFGDINDDYLTDKIIGVEDFKIVTGKAGFNILADYGSRFLPFVKVDEGFDPLVANQTINPLIVTGYRLSSYIYWVVGTNKNLKIVPKNPHSNTELKS